MNPYSYGWWIPSFMPDDIFHVELLVSSSRLALQVRIRHLGFGCVKGMHDQQRDFKDIHEKCSIMLTGYFTWRMGLFSRETSYTHRKVGFGNS